MRIELKWISSKVCFGYFHLEIDTFYYTLLVIFHTFVRFTELTDKAALINRIKQIDKLLIF